MRLRKRLLTIYLSLSIKQIIWIQRLLISATTIVRLRPHPRCPYSDLANQQETLVATKACSELYIFLLPLFESLEHSNSSAEHLS